jgi:enoyl-CoA hydratase/carnithine racemase
MEMVMTALEDSITEFGRDTLKKIQPKCSPLSLKVSFKAMHKAKDFPSLKEAIKMELRLATRLVVDFPDFAAGVKSLLVDKNSKPQWSHSVVTQVDDRVVKNIFAPFSQPELELNL